MDSKVRGTQLQTLLSYDEFEPLCTWQRDDAQDVLAIHLPEFKKEQLKIQISNTGLMKISGEKIAEGKKRSRFVKEVKVTKDYDSANIHAKFSQGCLRITLPKKVTTSVPSMLESSREVVTPLPQDGHERDSVDTDQKSEVYDVKTRVGRVLRSKTFTKVMVNVGFVVVMGFSVYIAYKYWSSFVQVDVDEY